MDTLTNIIIVVLISILIISARLLHLNNKTYKFLTALLYKISELAKEDIECGLDWKWRYNKLDKVSYNKIMFTSLFRPMKVSTFWKDDSFLRPIKNNHIKKLKNI